MHKIGRKLAELIGRSIPSVLKLVVSVISFVKMISYAHEAQATDGQVTDRPTACILSPTILPFSSSHYKMEKNRGTYNSGMEAARPHGGESEGEG